MAKRRTKKEKVNARHEYTISWQPKTADKSTSQSKKDDLRKEKTAKAPVNSRKLQKSSISSQDNRETVTKVKKDILKSAAISFVIIGLELVLFFSWQ